MLTCVNTGHGVSGGPEVIWSEAVPARRLHRRPGPRRDEAPPCRLPFHRPNPRHSIADLLTLVGAVRRIAYDVTLEAGDAMRRIRDAFAEYDENRAGDRGGE